MRDYTRLLKAELVHAMGCTEPIAIALCAAKAVELLGQPPEKMDVSCSGNIIKNAKNVAVPNGGGMCGIEIAASLGCFGGKASLGLEVLRDADEEALAKAKAFIDSGAISLYHAKGIEGVFVRVIVEANGQTAEAQISGAHNHFSLLRHNETILLQDEWGKTETKPQEELSFQDILEFAQGLESLKDAELLALLQSQADCNLKIAEEGLRGDYGASIGKTLLAAYPDQPSVRLRAYAAAASDARIAGSPMPVIINSGSGNQGITISLPLTIYAMDNEISPLQLGRALALANLLGLYMKSFVGKLSAFCSVVSAAAAAGAGLSYLQGQGAEGIAQVVSTTLLTSGGLFCDGAKASCSTKMATALENALLAIEMQKQGRSLPPLQGLAGRDIDETIRNVGRAAKEGMHVTDEVILDIMIGGGSVKVE